MEIQIENLKAKMRGVELNSYQKGLALDEFEKLIAHTEALEQQLRQYNVVGQSEQLKAFMDFAEWYKDEYKQHIPLGAIKEYVKSL